uniref:Reverse transcriptase domain-containing protein n=1 Tax=Vitis vinifera TaxID=29760 RepID=A5CAL7_VITVI|nr:hypothetical protein VITISV_011242 [Vitis vinifera]
MDFTEPGDHIHIMSWDDSKLEPIVVDMSYEVDKVILDPQTSTPFRLVFDMPPMLLTTSPFILSPDPDETVTQDFQYVIHGANRATYIVFSIDDIPFEGFDPTLPLYIFVGCSRHRVPYIILDTGFSLNICSLATKVTFGFGPSNFEPVSQTVQAYDSTCRETVEVEQFYRDYVVLPFDEHGSTMVLDMMRSMHFLLGLSLRHRQDGLGEFIATVDHDTPFDLGFVLIDVDYRYMTNEHGTSVESATMIDEAILHDEYSDKMLVIDMSQITDDVQLKTVSPLDLFGVLAIEMVKNVQLIPTPGLLIDVVHNDDVFEGIISPIVVESEHVDPPFSFDVLLRFVSCSDDATWRLRHYMIEYSMHFISRLDPLRYLFDKSALIGLLMRWLVLLTEFNIHYVTQKSIRESIVADHLALLPVFDGRAIDDDFLDEDVTAMTSLLAIRISCAGYPTKRTFFEFRFGILAPDVSNGSHDEVTTSKRILEKVDLKGYQIGKTKVFLRAGQMTELDARRNELRHHHMSDLGFGQSKMDLMRDNIAVKLFKHRGCINHRNWKVNQLKMDIVSVITIFPQDPYEKRFS